MNKYLMSDINNQEKGMILPTMLIVMLVVLTIGLSLSTLVLAQMERSYRGVMAANAMLTAEAGAEQTLHQLNEDSDFPGFSTEEVFIDDEDRGQSTYETRIEEGSVSNEKIITAIGRVYPPDSPDTAQVTRSVQLVVVGTTTLNYSVQTGPGGLIMSNSATIANGDVHVNGYLEMSNSSRIGSADNPSRVSVAHVNCPQPPTSNFPEPCGSGSGEPIDMRNQAHIYGEVVANNQVNGAQMSHPGLVSGDTVEELPLPETNRPSQKEIIEDDGQNMSNSQANCTQNNGNRVWSANTHITGGDVEIRRNCTVTVEGNIWINRSLTMRNSGTIRVSDSVTEPPVIMIDGSNGIEMRNSSAILTNSDGIGVQFITFHSAASCSPDCSDVTGTDLYNSRDIVTVNLNNSNMAAGSTFYARWSRVEVSQSGSVGGVMGQTVHLRNSGNISFGTELSSGETVWSIKNYQQVFE